MGEWKGRRLLKNRLYSVFLGRHHKGDRIVVSPRPSVTVPCVQFTAPNCFTDDPVRSPSSVATRRRQGPLSDRLLESRGCVRESGETRLCKASELKVESCRFTLNVSF